MLHPLQFGFRENHWAPDAILNLVKEIKQGLQQKQCTTAVAMDIEGAYDNLDPNILIERLIQYGCSGLHIQ